MKRKEDEMKRFFLAAIGLSCIVALVAVPGFAQKDQKDQKNQRTRTAGEVVAGTFAWGHDLSYVRDHFVKVAEEFPEDKYGYRPTEDVRTFGEIVMHVARYNHLTASHAMGRQSEDVREFAFHSKAEAVARLKKSFEELAEVFREKPDKFDLDALIHTSEHYGNLAVYYRLNGLVPPASR
jgi:hypothetical protein